MNGKTHVWPEVGPETVEQREHVSTSGHSPHAPIPVRWFPERSVAVEHQRRSSYPSY